MYRDTAKVHHNLILTYVELHISWPQEGGDDNDKYNLFRGGHSLTTHTTDPSNLNVGMTALVQCRGLRE